MDHVLIQHEPVRKDTISFALQLESIGSRILQHFGESPHFAHMTVKADDKTVKNQERIFSLFLSADRGRISHQAWC